MPQSERIMKGEQYKKNRKPFLSKDFRFLLKLFKQISGGEGEIRTLGTLVHTRSRRAP